MQTKLPKGSWAKNLDVSGVPSFKPMQKAYAEYTALRDKVATEAEDRVRSKGIALHRVTGPDKPLADNEAILWGHNYGAFSGYAVVPKTAVPAKVKATKSYKL